MMLSLKNKQTNKQTNINKYNKNTLGSERRVQAQIWLSETMVKLKV